jgi:hypothetical protein
MNDPSDSSITYPRRRPFARSLITVLRPFTLLIGAILKVVYPVLFGWLDRRLAEKEEQQLLKRVVIAFPYLFDSEGQKTALRDWTQKFPPGMDFATVIVRDDHIAYKFTHGLQEDGIAVRPIGNTGRWYELSLVISLLDGLEYVRREPLNDFGRASQLLQHNMAAIRQMLSPDQFPGVKKKLDRISPNGWAIINEHENRSRA